MHREDLMAYADGELSAERAREIETHLSDCAECREVLSAWGDVSIRLREWTVPTVSSALPARIASRLDRPRTGRLWTYRWWVAGGVVMASSFVFTAIRTRPAEPQFTPPMMSAPVPQAMPVSKEKVLQRFAADPAVPMIARTTDLTLTTRDFPAVRTALEAALRRTEGYIANINITTPENAGRTLDATLHVPAARLETLLADLRRLGHVTQESQNGSDVTKQFVDLDARLRNAQNTEQRLTALQRDRTGKLSDVLAVETEISRVRSEIEQMTAERASLLNRVDQATVHLTVTEEFKAQMNALPRSGGDRLWNAAAEGYRTLAESFMSVLEFLLAWGPSLILWALLLFWPTRLLWRRLKPL